MPTIEIKSPLALAVPAPVRIDVPADQLPKGELLVLRSASGAPGIPAQPDGDAAIVALIGPLPAGISQRYELEAEPDARPGVAVTAAGKQLDVTLAGKPFTSYHYDNAFARPFLYPVLGPGQHPVTRNYPMQQLPGEDHDHPHHRSWWTAYGEVNGADDWSEERGHGFIRHQAFRSQTSGPVFGGFVAENLWTGPDGAPLLRETRSVRAYNAGDERRLVDYDVVLTAAGGDVTFGDTKEGGIISFRVATSMDANKGGRIENASGGVTEKECWGKPSNWCDYSGPVDGSVVGIAVLDHPGNFRHPAHWHVRGYGLMGSNVFGDSSFAGDPGKRGQYTLPKGQSLTFR
ncbi:MAG: PmoA family protein, partial [Gemmatimonadales bacterium]